MNLQKARPAFLSAAAVYFGYLAYQLFDGRNNAEGDMSPFVRWFFIALFALAAVGLLIFAYRLWSAGRDAKNDGPDDGSEPDRGSKDPPTEE